MQSCEQVKLTLSKWSFPPDVRVQMRKCLVKRKHCLSPSFLSEREPKRTLLRTPRSLLDGKWMREPAHKEWEWVNWLRTGITWLGKAWNTKTEAHLVWRKFDLCLKGCHSPLQSSFQWPDSSWCSLCRWLHHVSSYQNKQWWIDNGCSGLLVMLFKNIFLHG